VIEGICYPREGAFASYPALKGDKVFSSGSKVWRQSVGRGRSGEVRDCAVVGKEQYACRTKSHNRLRDTSGLPNRASLEQEKNISRMRQAVN
jgi:hypothetical protein